MTTKVAHLYKQGRIGSTEVLAVWFSQKRMSGVKTSLGMQGRIRGRFIQLSSPISALTISTHKGQRVLREYFPIIQKFAKKDVRFQVAQRAGEAVSTKEYKTLKKALELLAITGQTVRDVDFKVSLKNIPTRKKLEAISKALSA